MLKLSLATAAVVLTLITPVSARTSHEFCGDRYCGYSSRTWGEGWGEKRYYSRVTHKKKHHQKVRAIKSKKRKVIPVVDADRIVAKAKIMPHPEGCPRTAFCGCGTALHVFGKNIRELWLAANWFKFPKADAAPGMVAVRQHHVFAILKVIRPGVVLAYDPNSGGHKTRIHVRSLAGYSVRDPLGPNRYVYAG